MIKDTTKKSRCPKKYALTDVEVAQLSGCSVSYVKQIRLGECNLNSGLAKLVLTIDEIGNTNKSTLIDHLKQVVKTPK